MSSIDACSRAATSIVRSMSIRPSSVFTSTCRRPGSTAIAFGSTPRAVPSTNNRADAINPSYSVKIAFSAAFRSEGSPAR